MSPHAVAGVSVEAVPYKEFYIVVKVQPDRATKKMFGVIAQIYRNLEEPPVMRNWLAVQEFASESDAYAFGVKQARAWIDEQD
jgi:hypothetical protein